jgi:peptide deformylase
MLKIIKYPNPILKAKCQEIPAITDEIRQLGQDMLKTMHANEGIGLAGPQVDKKLRIIVVDVGKGPLILVNPRIIKRSGRSCLEEGCLSLPGIGLKIKRAAEVEVEGLRLGEPQGSESIRPEDEKKIHIRASGILAHALQHEIDHLDGILIIDKVPIWKKWLALKKLKRD